MILIPTKSGTFAHCGLVFVNKASTDGGIALLAFAFAGKLAGGLGLSFADEGQRWRGAAPLQPYRRPTQLCSKQPNPAAKHPNPAAKHPTPAAEATDAAEAIIRDYGITN